MPKIPRYLITTSDERTWKFDRPVLFLGEWCRLYDHKHVWSVMDAIVAEPFGLKQSQKDHNFNYVQTLSNQLLSELTDSLNELHKTDHSLRYWNILLGHWLERYLSVIFNRFYTLEQALKNHNISGTVIFNFTNYDLTTDDSLSFIFACNDNIWNHVLYAKILQYFGNINIETVPKPFRRVNKFKKPGKYESKITKNIKHQVFTAINKVLTKLSFKNDALIINSFLPFIEEVKLQISLGQFPKKWESPEIEIKSIEQVKRSHLKFELKNYSGFERLIRLLLPEIIPICYIEGYDNLVNQTKLLHWPSKPKFIFNSNNFDTDEIFKFWTAQKVEYGTPYYIVQHGNNYGTYRYMNPSVEEITSDKFLTWGWTDGLQQHTPAFIFKTAGCKSKAYDPDGGLLLIEICVPKRITIGDGFPEFEIYFNEQFDFVGELRAACRNHLTIRLYQEYKQHFWSEDIRWREYDPNLNIDDGTTDIKRLIRKCRLVVYSYDSTGILETLSQNIPTLAFWQDGLLHIRESAKPFYQILIDAGIVHITPYSAATKVNEVWEDVSSWWFTEKVQGARKIFCDRYARVSKHPVRDLKKILLKKEKRLINTKDYKN